MAVLRKMLLFICAASLVFVVSAQNVPEYRADPARDPRGIFLFPTLTTTTLPPYTGTGSTSSTTPTPVITKKAGYLDIQMDLVQVQDASLASFTYWQTLLNKKTAPFGIQFAPTPLSQLLPTPSPLNFAYNMQKDVNALGYNKDIYVDGALDLLQQQ
eukprot:GHVQ01028091.1.p1 GENE.GHVQ01028091.1~~GHVQ01028091.1.p1  ORF type:complete len:157 (+),score=24.85 GHVQ01028091.1:266-736(+)